MTRHEIEQLKAEGRHYEAGRAAATAGEHRAYGPHYGLRRNREAARAAFYAGYDAPGAPSTSTPREAYRAAHTAARKEARATFQLAAFNVGRRARIAANREGAHVGRAYPDDRTPAEVNADAIAFCRAEMAADLDRAAARLRAYAADPTRRDHLRAARDLIRFAGNTRRALQIDGMGKLPG